jgi:hypothetical protein
VFVIKCIIKEDEYNTDPTTSEKEEEEGFDLKFRINQNRRWTQHWMASE